MTSQHPALERFTDTDVLKERGPKNSVDPFQPYHMLVEPEFCAHGRVEDVATVFLSNRECPFRCLMCDLWKNTTDDRVPAGAIPQQIRHAIEQFPPAQHIKLYNSGNFFDAQAIPPEDYEEIASLVSSFNTVIVENHPRLCNDRCSEFQDLCATQLEVALGLETSHQATLQQLNKQMTTDDFARACEFLLQRDIRVRSFILLKPPHTSEEQGIERAIESVRFAFDNGVDCCAVIPTRAGNGIMDRLQQAGLFQPPQLRSLELVIDEALGWHRGRVFADLWEARQFAECAACATARIERLNVINLSQQEVPPVECHHCG
ncbi:MAG TPA: radical SAM protein [Planctomycetes bacterium]|nr:radical SAM protein [Fuerstiella sp.]HIK90486.1 radical SAM protein [Planctomycetota bacterium]